MTGAFGGWRRITLLAVFGYEALGTLFGGVLLTAGPDGRYLKMAVSLMHGAFDDFLIPGVILVGLGLLNAAALVSVFRRSPRQGLATALALGGLAIWFVVEIAILRQVHWLHAMWGLPVVLGGVVCAPSALIQWRRESGAPGVG
jgi:hypothetical protein